ncbi:30S ribosomal protein S4 [Candidatus Nanohalococcus occultus]|uniref:Ribosomal protein S4 or related protein n=1 Tax=Candidatus Nanohalococcus occultus TaxID=2978047 RepID=A0ABY8CKS7_9ARCH|nr:Ribosomal protein S4 or related protein [Candidatus Nanohaloarchaeota archaeon SVXNc]
MVKKLNKQYETPNEGWNEERINREDSLKEDYGLSKKQEIHKAQSQVRDLRRQARKLAAAEDENRTQKFLGKVNRLGLIREDDHLEDVLSLKVTDILDRRLQTAVNRRGFSDTASEARQLVVHGHVYVDGQRVTVPSYLLTQEEEKEVELRMPEPEEEPEEVEEETEEAEEEASEESEETTEEDEE